MGKLLQPEPDATVRPKRAEAIPLVGDIHVEFPYDKDDICKRCGNPLSRYNPHVVCFRCVETVRADFALSSDPKVRKLLEQRRRRNPKCRPISKHLNVALLESTATSPNSGRGRHHPQSGHN